MTRYRVVVVHRGEPLPEVKTSAGVEPVGSDERERYTPDAILLLLDGDVLRARCSCWWTGTPPLNGEPTGFIGHYAAADADSAQAVLDRACDELATHDAAIAVGPIDGSTWRRYRFVVERGTEPTFFLEPDNPDDWPTHWTAAGFEQLATYTSAVNDSPDHDDPRTIQIVQRLERDGIRIRTIDPQKPDEELAALFALSSLAFRDNFLYTPISNAEFLAQYRAILPYVDPSLVLLAERGDTLVGFIFALPDLAEAERGETPTTAILKTLAVAPDARSVGLGSALLDLAQRRASELGFRRVIHALIHEQNVSRRISDRYARTIRRYALFARRLKP